jgi:hypothetical protein
MIFGLLVMVFAVRFLKVLIFAVTIIITMTISLVVYAIIVQFGKELDIWLVLSVALVVSVVLGFYLMKMTRMFICCLGGYLGYMIYLFLYNLFLRLMPFWQGVVYYIGALIFIFVAAYITSKIAKIVLIVATSVLGSFLFIKASSLVIGGYVSEAILMDLMRNDEIDVAKTVNIFINNFRLQLGRFLFTWLFGYSWRLLQHFYSLECYLRRRLISLMKLL